MNYYKVGYHSYEESPYIMLSHKEKYTKEFFNDLCAKITANMYVNRKELFPEEYKYYQELLPEDKETLCDYDPKESFQDYYTDVTEYLVKHHGFEYVETQARFSPFGWAKFLPKDDWGHDGLDCDSALKAIRDLL